MEYQALYRKYRPQKFSDVVDQESTLKILTNSLKDGHISHAYLFSGPRGTGKTTIAKLVAKSVNCLNLNDDFSICSKCENCLDILNNSPDIIEIDAASNNGVDEIRELKSKINLVPNKLKYKVYIIDEVHMLSISAFNALLKTLEEPPSHVIFILATTEFYKVPATIISRCQCLNFTRIKTSSIEKRLREIADLEKINITDDAIHEIAEYSEGGMRDALGLLDKLASYSLEKITEEDFLRINGLISKKDMDNFIKSILEKKTEDVLNLLNKFDELGFDFSKLLEKLMQESRDMMVNYYTKEINTEINPQEIYKLIMCFNETYNLLKESINRKIIMEVNLLKFMNSYEDSIKEKDFNNVIKKETKNEINTFISREITLGNNEDNEKNVGNIEKRKGKYEINLEVKKQRINNTFAMASKVLKNIALEKFKKIDDYLIDDEYSYIAGLLKDVSIGVVSDKDMIIIAKFESILDNLYQDFSKTTDFINKIMESSYNVVFLNEKEFKEEVSLYKKHLNEPGYYEYKEEEKPFIKIQDNIEKKEDLGYTKLVDSVLDVFGSEYVEIE